jgi:hypothetical protein
MKAVRLYAKGDLRVGDEPDIRHCLLAGFICGRLWSGFV